MKPRMTMTAALRGSSWVLLSLLLLTITVGCSSRTAPTDRVPDSLELLVDSIGQRLAVMPKIAEWKRAHDVAIRDRAREVVVLDAAVEAVAAAAQQAGCAAIPEDAVRQFYQAQIAAAVEIQQQITTRPAQPGGQVEDLETVLRPQLDRLGVQIANLLVQQEKRPSWARLERLANRYWQVDGLDRQRSKQLLEALDRVLTVLEIG